jgi:hypothetical protein
VEIPVLHHVRTVGTYVESAGAEWKAACKRGRSLAGKAARQSEGVKRTEIEVGKSVSHVSRKAAIVHEVPVP